MSSTLTKSAHPTALYAQHPLAFGYLESCNTSEGGPERYHLNRTMSREVHIGRGPHNDLVLEDPHISTHYFYPYSSVMFMDI